ncbi:putative cytochrome P450 [Aspergillus japonicus CBS 114.51]|uniref:Putative cytochrome P450 n=1 Tax=Aspergillus japonicus CBS 114.51 TaxID=1448312 RepID=A0A8T8WL83_ASPJA|nr:putative cytochrome P450 [Aspergillus japonicus CBS 114.51]RAH76615.1 putative cytochrome P450 [Aspergillus japonicus CBS 114.51]
MLPVSSTVFSSTGLLYLIGIWVASRLVRALYNVSPFHPLSHIPGPKLAAATFLYEAWFDLIRGGRFTHEIRRLHEIYGPVVRINPEELHFNDPNFIDEVYPTAGRTRNKQVHYVTFATGPTAEAMFATIDHKHHRIRRGAMNKFFSRAQIARLEPEIKRLTDQLCDKIIRLGTKDHEPLDITTAYSCFTADVISGYCFGESFGFVEQEGWEPNFRDAVVGLLETIFLFRFIPVTKLLVPLVPFLWRWLPRSLQVYMDESTEKMPARVRQARQEFETGTIPSRPTIFHALLTSSLPEAERTDYRLTGDGLSLNTAGTETTAWTLTVATYYLLSQPKTLARLVEELESADATNRTWNELEKLPYLSAVIAEALRLSYGVSPRSPRIAPNERLIYRGRFQGREIVYHIPPGTPVGMSNAINHHNEDVFPDSDNFRVERWLEADEAQRRRLETSLTSFSRGSRSCVGINLAYCNLYVALAALAVQVLPRTQLYQTTVEDVAYDHDVFVGVPKRDSKGVRVVVS